MRRTGRILLAALLAAIVPACGAAGGGGTLSSTVAPAAPTGLAAQGGNGRVLLTWEPSPAAGSYKVRRSPTSGGPYLPLPAGDSVVGTTFTDTTAINGSSYFYAVSAINRFGESVASAETLGTPGFVGTMIAAGYRFSVALLQDGSLWSWGTNQSFQLGDGTTRFLSPVAVPVAGLSGIGALACGWDHTLAVLDDGTVRAWGSNAFGVLGDGSSDPKSNVPVQVTGISDAVDVAAGASHSMVLKSDGTVWTWGKAMGPAGADTTIAAPVAGLTGIIQIAAGSHQCFALRNDGTLWAWGMNDFAELGIGFVGGSPVLTPSPVVNLTSVIEIGSGTFTGIALRADGTVWTWGRNIAGELGIGPAAPTFVNVPVRVTALNGIRSVAAGGRRLLAIEAAGTVVSWGGDVGSNVPTPVDGLTNVRTVKSGLGHALALGGNGEIWSWGTNDVGQLGSGTGAVQPSPKPVANLTDVTAMAGAYLHTLAVRSDGTVWGWGTNTGGALGTAVLGGSPFRVQIAGLTGLTITTVGAGQDPVSGGGFSAALTSTGKVYTWGDNQYSQLAQNVGSTATPGPVPAFTATTPDTTITAISTGLNHTTALAQSGNVWSWGRNTHGQLGDNTLVILNVTPVQAIGLAGVTEVAAGALHSLAIVGSGPTSTVWAWGDNASGQLGYVGPLSRVPVQVPGITGAVAVSAGNGYSLALLSDGTVWSWGANGSGQLGDGAPIISSATRAIPAPVIALAGVTAIAAGNIHVMALRSDGTVWTWGNNTAGPLGNDTVEGSSVPVQATGLTGVTRIAAGEFHSLAIRSDGSAWAWGWNSQGQIGDGSTGSTVVRIRVQR